MFKYERIMEFDQERMKRISFFIITIIGGIIYTVFYCINIHRGTKLIKNMKYEKYKQI